MKKIKISYKGHAFYLTKDELDMLIKRFHWSNREDKGDGHWIIRVPCPLCQKYMRRHCKGCTFKKYGCTQLLREISGSCLAGLYLGESCLVWKKGERGILHPMQKIHRVLVRAKLGIKQHF